MKTSLVALLLVLSGCVTTSEVVPASNGEYLLTGHASGGLNAGKGTAAAMQKASAYCGSQGKKMEVVNTEFHGMAAVGGESTSLVFRCVG